MKCAWDAYLRLLPQWMRAKVDFYGKETLQEIRLRVDKPPELILKDRNICLQNCVSADDLKYSINAASQYSPWSSATIADGYITAQGGHRIGICGSASIVNGRLNTVTEVTSLCIRTARDFEGIAGAASKLTGSILVIGKPGSGKTTFLRDLARKLSNIGEGSVAVVDERRELFPTVNGSFCFDTGRKLDVFSGCNKAQGIDMMIRTMNPQWVVMDEITSVEDCNAIIQAGWCGVSILASAHAGTTEDFARRPVYRPLIEFGLFDYILVMQPDKSWKVEKV